MISVFGSDIGEKEIQYVTECLRSQWLGLGKKVAEFEKKFSEQLSVPNFLMVDNCSNGLYMAMKLLDLPPGSRVMVPSITWVSCAQAVLLAGHEPVFVDVDYDTMNITPKIVEHNMCDSIKAIMVVHYGGLPVDMDPILSFGVPVVEDAAHAVHSTYKGRACGTIGDIGVYSFDSIKNLVCGDGGGITCKDAGMYERAKVMRYCGIGKSGFEAATSSGQSNRWWEYNIQEPFIRMLPTNISASIGLAQLERLQELQDRRRCLWCAYTRGLDGIVEYPVCAGNGRHSYFTYCIKVDRRDDLANRLFDAGIYSTLRYHPLHMNKIYGQQGTRLMNSERLNERALNLPLHPRLTIDDVERICGIVRRHVEEHG